MASSDTAPEKSVWLSRRNKVVTEAAMHKKSQSININEFDMIADSCTKYDKHGTWVRHMHYILNLPGDPPDCYPAGHVKEAIVKARGKKTMKKKKK